MTIILILLSILNASMLIYTILMYRFESNILKNNVTDAIQRIDKQIAHCQLKSSEYDENYNKRIEIQRKFENLNIDPNSVREFISEVFTDNGTFEQKHATIVLNDKIREFKKSGYDILESNIRIKPRTYCGGTIHTVYIKYRVKN